MPLYSIIIIMLVYLRIHLDLLVFTAYEPHELHTNERPVAAYTARALARVCELTRVTRHNSTPLQRRLLRQSSRSHHYILQYQRISNKSFTQLSDLQQGMNNEHANAHERAWLGTKSNSRWQATKISNTDQQYTCPKGQIQGQNRCQNERRRDSPKVQLNYYLGLSCLPSFNRLAAKFDDVGDDNSPKTHQNPIANQPLPATPGTIQMVIDTNQEYEDPTFFTGTRTKIAPPGWQYHETDTQGEGAVNYWTHTDGGEVTTYLPGEVFVAKHPSYLGSFSPN